MKNKLVKLLGVLASIATIVGLYVTVFGVPKIFQPNRKYVFNKSDFIANSSNAYSYLNKGDTLRLIETLDVSWSGVHNCGTSARSQSEYKSKYQEWKSRLLQQVDSLVFISSDFIGGDAVADQRKNPVTNVRSCNGSGTIECSMELIVQ